MNDDITHISGIIPENQITDDSAYPRGEAAVGALMMWANKLCMTTYVMSVPYEREEPIAELYEMDEDFSMTAHTDTVLGAFHNRMSAPSPTRSSSDRT